MNIRNHTPFRVLVLTLALAGSATMARADLTATCAPEIEQFCADVDQGRGRITACLGGHSTEIGSACLSEVQGALQGFLVPQEARRLLDPAFRAELPQVCEPAAERFCSGVARGDGRIFSCLYARTNRIGEACSSAAQATIEQAQ